MCSPQMDQDVAGEELIDAAYEGDVVAVRKALEAKADPNFQDEVARPTPMRDCPSRRNGALPCVFSAGMQHLRLSPTRALLLVDPALPSIRTDSHALARARAAH